MFQLEKQKFEKLEKNQKSYRKAYLTQNDYLLIKNNFELTTYKNEYGFNAFLVKKKYVLIVNEENYWFDLYKSIDDFEIYLDMAYRDKEKIQKKEELFHVNSFIESNGRIVDYLEFTRENFMKKFNVDPKIEFKANESFIIENYIGFAYFNSFSSIFCFENKEDLDEFEKLNGKSVFFNVNPYGDKLISKADEIKKILSDKFLIRHEKLDYSIKSLELLDEKYWNSENQTEHFFYEVFLALTIYLGKCIEINNKCDFFLQNDQNQVYEPVIRKKNGDEITLSIYVYETYINDNRVILSIYQLYRMFF